MRRSNTALLLLLLLVATLVWRTAAGIRPDAAAQAVFVEAPEPAVARRPALLSHRTTTPARTRAGPYGQVSGDDLLSRGASPPLARALRGGLVRVHGTVRRDGVPVVGYGLAFQGMGEGLAGADDWDFTDDDGSYSVRLTPGGYLVLNDDGGPWATNVAVPAGENELALDVDLPRAAIRGRVVRGEACVPVKGATVCVLRSTALANDADAITQGLMARAGRARTSVTGSFELLDLAPGTYLVTARYGDSFTPPVEVTLVDSAVEGLQLVFRSGLTLEGVVRGPSGAPAALELMVCPGDRLTSLAQLQYSRGVVSDAEGRFAVADLQPGPYVIFGAGTSNSSNLALQAAIELRPCKPLELLARTCGTLLVSVVDPRGAPVEDAYLDVRSHDGSLVLASLEWLADGATSSAEGRIQLVDVMPGRYRIAAGLGGRLGPFGFAEVRSGEAAELLLVLDSSATR